MLSKDILQVKLQWLKYITIIVLTISILFRCANLEQRLYWHDEVINSFGVAGYTVAEATQELSQQSLINIDALQKYQYPNKNKSFLAPIAVLANNEPQNPPLYYLLSWFWLTIFGNSVTAARGISVAISLFVFPAAYLLCRELFDSDNVAKIAMILIAVSPFHLLYAQEARPYSLWTLMILLSSFFLLRGIRSNKFTDWIYYFITLSLSFYTFPFSLFVAIGQGIYLLTIAIGTKKKVLVQYLVASFCSIMAFAPWLLYTAINAHKISDWRAEEIGVLSLAKSWLGNISRIFVDFNLDSSAPVIYLVPLTLFLFLLTVYAVYYLCSKTSFTTWLFIVTLIGVTAIAIALPDLISGGQRSRVARYLTPCFLGIQLAVAYYLGTEIVNSRLWRRLSSKIILGCLIVGGILSCTTFLQADNWWHKSWSNVFDNNSLKEAATVINQSRQPILIAPEVNSLTEDDFFELLSLTHLVKPQTQLKFGYHDLQLAKIIESNNTIFIYQPLADKTSSQSQYKVRPIVVGFGELTTN